MPSLVYTYFQVQTKNSTVTGLHLTFRVMLRRLWKQGFSVNDDKSSQQYEHSQQHNKSLCILATPPLYCMLSGKYWGRQMLEMRLLYLSTCKIGPGYEAIIYFVSCKRSKLEVGYAYEAARVGMLASFKTTCLLWWSDCN